MTVEAIEASGRGSRIKRARPLETRLRRGREAAIKAVLFLCAFISVVTTLAIIFTLLQETVGFFRQVSIIEFLTGTKWTPQISPKHYGILPLLSGTLLVAAGGAIVALPAGLLTAIFLSEYAPSWLRSIVKPVLEVLAGAVPRSLRVGAYALGSNKFEVSVKVVVPAALSGIVASFILAISRAVGETMIVALAAGATPNLTWNPLQSVQTMTAYIVQVSLGDTPQGSIEFRTIFAVAMALFVMTLALNIVSQYLLHRFREIYE
jgi:phosphate transport system permease protein